MPGRHRWPGMLLLNVRKISAVIVLPEKKELSSLRCETVPATADENPYCATFFAVVKVSAW